MNDISNDAIRVLHVDDEPDFAATVSALLERQDDRFDVETATSASAGLEYLETAPVDCVVSDYDMPVRTGLDFLQAVRAEWAELPFILYTGKGSEEVASDAITAGATDYLQKDTGSEQYELLANRIGNAVEQTRANAERKRNERRFEAVFEDPQMLVGALDPDGTLRDVNRTAMRYTDTDRQTELGELFWETSWWNEETRPSVREWVKRAANGDYVEFEAPHTRGHDDPRFVRGTIRPVRTDDGDIASLVASAKDVTDERIRTRELQRYETIVEALGDPVFVTGPEGNYEYVNDAFIDSIGYDREELIGAHPSKILVDGGVERGRAIIRDLLDDPDRCSATWEVEQITADGDRFPAEIHSALLPPDDDGNFQGTAGVGRDISARRQYEAELRRYEAIVEALGDPVFAIDTAGCYTYVNDAFVEETGDPRAEIIGEPAASVVPDADAERTNDLIRDLLRSDERTGRIEVDRIRADGERIPHESHLALLLTDDGEYRGIAGVTRDISERKRRERERTRLIGRFDRVLDVTDTIVWAVDLGAGSFEHSGPIERVAGLEMTDADDPVAELTLAVHPADQESVERSIAAVVGGTEDALDVEYRTHPDKGRVRWLRTRAFVREGDDGPRLLGISSEVTSMKERERRLDQFAKVVSHDLRNPLSVAKARLSLARETSASDHFEAAETAHERMETLISNLLDLAREGSAVTDAEWVDLESLVEGCWTTVDTGRAELDIAMKRTVRGEPSRLKQLFENLLRNAIEHGGDGVSIRIGELPDGFFVADDGPGIDPDDRMQVFEPGFSTAPDGTGFGLSIAHRIVTAHDWQLRVTASETGGARFEVRGVGEASESP